MRIWAQNLDRLIGQSRKRKGDVAQAAGIEPSTLSRILNDDNYDPGASILLRLAEALGVDAGELLRGADESGGVVARTESHQPRYTEIDIGKLLTDIAKCFLTAVESAERAAAEEAERARREKSKGA